ncbi:TPA: hypothetical protein ACH3X1_004025 [Trebouxia sp. C0004]
MQELYGAAAGASCSADPTATSPTEHSFHRSPAQASEPAKSIAEHHQSEAREQRKYPWQYERRSAVINMIFAALTFQEHGFL